MLQLQLCLPLLPFTAVLQLLYLSYEDAVKDVKHVKAFLFRDRVTRDNIRRDMSSFDPMGFREFWSPTSVTST